MFRLLGGTSRLELEQRLLQRRRERPRGWRAPLGGAEDLRRLICAGAPLPPWESRLWTRGPQGSPAVRGGPRSPAPGLRQAEESCNSSLAKA
eukprot:6024381-Alexandrium_andersonii.AAC.1